MSHHPPPKTKRQIVLERSKRFQLLNQHAEQHQAETKRVREDEAGRVADLLSHEEAGPDGEAVWSEKLQSIRLRNGSRKKRARGMWDRFATGGGGMAR